MVAFMCSSLEAGRNWTMVYNGSDTEWTVSDDELKYHEAYVFKVAARNRIGWGSFSNDSLPLVYTPRQCSYVLVHSVYLLNNTCYEKIYSVA